MKRIFFYCVIVIFIIMCFNRQHLCLLETFYQKAYENGKNEVEVTDTINENTQPNNGSCVLRTFHQYAYIYNQPGGEIIDSIINDTIKEDYVSIQINNSSKCGFAHISAVSFITRKETNGWIQVCNLGINPSTYSTIYLHVSPTFDSTIKDSIESPMWGDLYNVIDAEKGWLYIKWKDKEGWLSPEDQCADLYTTCC